MKPSTTAKKKSTEPPNWAELEAKYKSDIETLAESAEMATIEKEIAEERLDNCERELKELKEKLAESAATIDLLQSEQANKSTGIANNESAVTIFQLRKVEEQNELLKQALVKLRDISSKDKKALEELQIENEDLQLKLIELQEKEQKFLDQVKIYEEQIDVSQSAQDMIEKLTQQRTDLEDKIREMLDDLDCMNKLRDLDEQLLQTARETEIDLTGENDKLRVQISELVKKNRDLEDYLSDQGRTLAKLKEDNRQQSEQIVHLKDHFKEGETIEQQKHQIENVAYKLNFSESKMAEKEAELGRYKRNLASMEEQMNNLSTITKEQAVQIDDLKSRLDAKISENSELQRALKKKMEELSELEIRKEMADKKLQSIQRDTESKLINLNRTIDTLKGIEVQREEEIRRLMEDNELIENERRELRDQLNKSNRSLERSMQTGNMSISMVTAQDTSLASLGISFQANPTSMQSSSPMLNYQQAPTSQHNNQSMLGVQHHNQQTQNASLGSVIGPGVRHAAVSSDADDSIFLDKIKDLGTAFDLLIRRNHELQLDLALKELNNRVPPYNRSKLSDQFDIDGAKSLRAEVLKLKREIRSAMINQKICPRSRNIFSHLRNENFSNSKLTLKYQRLENEATALMSSSSLSRYLPKAPTLHSTPVK